MIIGISGLAGAGKDTSADMLVDKFAYAKVSLADPLKRICKDVYNFTDEQLWGPSEMRNEPDKRYPRAHTWVKTDTDIYISCACCGQKTRERMVEEDVFVPDLDDVKQCYLSPRYALQLLGTEWGRRCYPNTWIDYALRMSKRVMNIEPAYSYSQQMGIFYTNVASMCGSYEGIVIPDCRFKNEIEAIHSVEGKVVRIKRYMSSLDGAAAQHASEAEQRSIPDSEFDYIIDNNGSLEALSIIVEQVMAEFGH